MQQSGDIDRFFRPSDLSAYSFRRRLLIRLAGMVFYLLVLGVGKTVRFTVEGRENLDSVWDERSMPVCVTWHNQTFLAAYWLRNRRIIALTSKSFDGEYIARFIQRLGFGAVRGSSSRGGVGALVEMARLMRMGYPTSINPDGPRGPRHEAKMGPVLLAKKTGKPVLPIAVLPDRFWAMKSWDRYRIPKPFTKATVRIGRAIFVRSEVDGNELEAKRLEMQRALDEVNQESI